MSDTDEFMTGKQLLAQCGTREQRLERACRALMEQLNQLHVEYKYQDLSEHIDDPNIFCSCADAYRMGHEALKE